MRRANFSPLAVRIFDVGLLCSAEDTRCRKRMRLLVRHVLAIEAVVQLEEILLKLDGFYA